MHSHLRAFLCPSLPQGNGASFGAHAAEGAGSRSPLTVQGSPSSPLLLPAADFPELRDRKPCEGRKRAVLFRVCRIQLQSQRRCPGYLWKEQVDRSPRAAGAAGARGGRPAPLPPTPGAFLGRVWNCVCQGLLISTARTQRSSSVLGRFVLGDAQHFVDARDLFAHSFCKVN